MDTKMPYVAGAFYPGDRETLTSMIEEYIKNAKLSIDQPPKIVVSPHAGYIYSGPVAGYAYKALSMGNFEKFIILGPSHYVPFEGVIENGFKAWRTPLGDIETFSIDEFPKAKEPFIPEHSLEVQVPFIQQINPHARICPLMVGMNVDHKKVAMAIEKHIDDKTAIVISSDLSHYLPYPNAVMRDKRTIDLILSMDINNFLTEGDACGREGIGVGMYIAKHMNLNPKLLIYLNSGDTAGPKDSVVGYAAIGFY